MCLYDETVENAVVVVVLMLHATFLVQRVNVSVDGRSLDAEVKLGRWEQLVQRYEINLRV